MKTACRLAFVAALSLISACGDSDNRSSNEAPFGTPGSNTPQNPAPNPGLRGSGNDELSEFSTKTPAQVANLISAFGIEGGNEGAFVAFYSGQRLFSGVVQRLSSLHYRISASVGYYSEAEGKIKARIVKRTCPGTGASSIDGTTLGSQLILSRGATTVVLPRIYPTISQPAQGMVIEWGCFAEGSGIFTKHEWIYTGG